jgi:uncharacterized membrane protein
MQSLTANEPSLAPGRVRVESIDLLRGLIMVIMALDHVRDYFHAAAQQYDPTDLGKTTAILFFTRWITHFCAPLFMLLSGMSASLVGERKTKKELSAFLIKRGVWLVVLEFTVTRFGWYFNLFAHEIDFIVIWALGISMVVLGLLVHLPRKYIMVFGLVLIFGHNLLDKVNVAGDGVPAFLWSLAHQFGFFVHKGWQIIVIYPLIPWIGVMALGYSLGSLYAAGFPAERRKKILFRLGVSAILLFIILRFVDHYGDGSHWKAQSSLLFSLLAFLKTSKYPPSLLYLLMTLGPGLLFLSWSEKMPGWLGRKITVYGRVPLFYYVLHIYLLHLIALFAAGFCGHVWKDMILDHFIGFDNPQLNGYGFSLGVVYLVWAFVVVALYPLCIRYDRYKRANRNKWWLSYL